MNPILLKGLECRTLLRCKLFCQILELLSWLLLWRKFPGDLSGYRRMRLKCLRVRNRQLRGMMNRNFSTRFLSDCWGRYPMGSRWHINKQWDASKLIFSLHPYTNDVKYHRIKILTSVGKGVENDVGNFSLHKVFLFNCKILIISI